MDGRDIAALEEEIYDLRAEAGKWGSPGDPVPYRRLAVDFFQLACRHPAGSAARQNALKLALLSCAAARERTTDAGSPLPAGCPAR